LLYTSAGKTTQRWLTLFDHTDDDVYDGDFTYDDEEIPRILLEYGEAQDREVKSSTRITSSGVKTVKKKEIVEKVETTTKVVQQQAAPPPVRVRPQVTTTTTTYERRTEYRPMAQFEIGESPSNTNNYELQSLREELHGNLSNIIAGLRDDQQIQFEEEDQRVEVLKNLEQVHTELKGEHQQDLLEGERVEELYNNFKNERDNTVPGQKKDLT
jgi:hypothetical protein